MVVEKTTDEDALSIVDNRECEGEDSDVAGGSERLELGM